MNRSVVAYDHDTEMKDLSIDERIEEMKETAADMTNEGLEEDQAIIAAEEDHPRPPQPEEEYSNEDPVEETRDDLPEGSIEEPEKVKRHSNKDKRVDVLVSKYSEAARERDIASKERDEATRVRDELSIKSQQLEAALVQERMDKIEREINHASFLMEQAHSEGDSEAFVKISQHLNQLSAQKGRMDETLESVNESIQETQRHFAHKVYESKPDPLAKQRNQILRNFSHPRELKRAEYQDWLDRNPVVDPHDDDYDPDIAQQIGYVKKEFNRYLYVNKKTDIIGTEDYYDNLDAVIQNHFSPYVNESIQHTKEEPVSRRQFPSQRSAPVSSVSRQGYTKSSYSSSSLPPLSEAERMMATRSEFKDPKTGRALNEAEKIQLWRQEKLNYMKEKEDRHA